MVLTVLITTANVHDTIGGKLLLDDLAAAHPGVTKVRADGGYQNSIVNHGARLGIEVEVVQRPRTKGFEPMHEWVGDRAYLRLAEAAPPPGAGLRSPPTEITDDDPLGDG
ncbi:transposase [Streptomyces sp. CA-251387]|uniref:transposase n=1 Tax=Streptomyces sp. CA-251387 TaxID=3240064 RepID=UPI003D8AE9A2